MKRIFRNLIALVFLLVSLLEVTLFGAQPVQFPQKPLPLMILFDEGGCTSYEAFYAAIGQPCPMLRRLADGLEQKIPMVVSAPLFFDFIISCEKSLPKNPYAFLSLEKFGSEEHKSLLMQWMKAYNLSQSIFSYEDIFMNYEDLVKMHEDSWVERNLMERLENPNKWRIYESVTKDFVILLPVKYFYFRPCFEDAKVVREIRARDIKNHFVSQDSTQQLSAVQEYAFKPVDIKNFVKIFNLTQPLVPKNIYLAGHGSSGGYIAGVTIEQYKELLKLFSKIKVKFLYVSSCFAGGINLLVGHEDFTRNQSSSNSVKDQYVIVVNGTEDTTTTHKASVSKCKNYLRLFFARLDQWQLAQTASFQNNFSCCRNLFNVLSSMYLQSPGTENLPSVFEPGKGASFKPISLPNTFNLTCDLLKTSELIEIDSDKIDAALICPSMIRDIPLVVKGHKMPYFACQMRGQGQHFVETLIAPDVEFSELIRNCFLPQDREYASHTGWFFDVCVCCNTEIESLPKGIIVLYGLAIGRGKGEEKSFITFRVKNDIYYVTVNRDQKKLWNIPHVEVSKATLSHFQRNIKEIIQLTRPSRELLECASGGCESIESLNDCAQAFETFACQEVPFSPILTGFAAKYLASTDETLKAAAMRFALEILAFRALLQGNLKDVFAQLTQGIIDELVQFIVQDRELYALKHTFVRRHLGGVLADAMLTDKMPHELKGLIQDALREKKSVQLILGLAVPLMNHAQEFVDSELLRKLFDLAKESVFAVKESQQDRLENYRAEYKARINRVCASQFLVAAMKRHVLPELKLDEIASHIVSKSSEGFLTIAEGLAETRKFPELVKILTEPIIKSSGSLSKGWIQDSGYTFTTERLRNLYLISSVMRYADNQQKEELQQHLRVSCQTIRYELEKNIGINNFDDRLKFLYDFYK